jgi:ACT domain-containing protein
MYGTGGYGTGYGAMGTPPAGTMSREDRKKMVQEKYQQVLGRKVSDQDTNYFVNLGLSEDQMIRRIVESQEHADLVSAAQEYQKIKPEYDKLKTDVQRLGVQLKDKESLLSKQNDLIAQKNKSIHNLEHTQPQVVAVEPTAESGVPVQQVSKERQSTVDRVLKRLNDIFD